MTSSINQGTRGRGRGMNRSMQIALLRKRPSDLGIKKKKSIFFHNSLAVYPANAHCIDRIKVMQ